MIDAKELGEFLLAIHGGRRWRYGSGPWHDDGYPNMVTLMFGFEHYELEPEKRKVYVHETPNGSRMFSSSHATFIGWDLIGVLEYTDDMLKGEGDE